MNDGRDLSGPAVVFEGGEGQTSADDDLEKKDRREEYLNSLFNKSPNRMVSLDLFLMLD